MTRAMWSIGFAGLLIVSTGCRTTCERHPWCHRNAPPPAPKPVFVVPPQPTPIGQPIQQSGGFPVVPPGTLVNPPPPVPVPPPVPSMSKTPGPPEDPLWRPRESNLYAIIAAQVLGLVSCIAFVVMSVKLGQTDFLQALTLAFYIWLIAPVAIYLTNFGFMKLHWMIVAAHLTGWLVKLLLMALVTAAFL